MPNIVIANWQWADDGEGFVWQAPGRGFIGCLDLRGYTAKGKRGGTPGMGLFVYPGSPVIDGAIDLGTDAEGQVRVADRDGIKTKLGLDAALVSTKVTDIISELFQVHADPTGVDRFAPLRGSQRRGMSLYLGGFGTIITGTLDATALANTIAAFQANFRRHIAEGVTPFISLRKWTGNEMLKLWGTMSDEHADELMPSEFRFIGWQQPETTLTDNFNRGDSAPGWGTASGGHAWGEVTGNMDIVSNTGQSPTGSTENFSRADSDLATDEHSSEFTTAVISGNTTAGFGCCVRCSSSAATYVRGVINNRTSGDDTRFITTVTTDTPTNIAQGGTNGDPTSGTTLVKVDSADLITLQFDGGDELTVTNTHGSGNLRVGASKRSSSMVPSWDDFTGTDLGGVTTRRYTLTTLGVG